MNFLRILLILCLTSLGQTIRAGSAEEVYSKFADNIVTLDTYDRVLIRTKQGSGVVIDRGTGNGFEGVLLGPWILTNYHVIARAGLIVATSRGGSKSNAWVIYFDRDHDIALLQTHLPLKFSKISAAGECKVGNEIFAIGAPKGLGWTINNGIVSALRKDAGAEVVQFTAPISPGSSGGGLFTGAGELLGITSFGVKEGQNLNFALRIMPEFVASLARFRERGAVHPHGVYEGAWNAGHHEPQNAIDFQKMLDDPSVRPAWWQTNKQMRLWDAHLRVIENSEKRMTEAKKAMSKSEITAAFKEWMDQGGIGGPLKYPFNQIKRECDQAYIQRFHDFPDDIEGWERAFFQLSPKSARIESFKRACELWPWNSDVIRAGEDATSDSLAALPEDRRIAQSVAELLFQHVRKVVDQLPARTDLDGLFAPFKSSSEFERMAGEFDIRRLIGEIEVSLDASTGFPVSAERKSMLLNQLRDKGWIKSE